MVEISSQMKFKHPAVDAEQNGRLPGCNVAMTLADLARYSLHLREIVDQTSVVYACPWE